MKQSSVGTSSLVPLETTAIDAITEVEASVLLKFAALFSREVFLSDTVLGDHHLFLDSYVGKHGNRELYELVAGMVREGILRALFRDKVVIRGRVLVDSDPTLREIYMGWLKRDKEEWDGKAGITTAGRIQDGRLRLEYYEQTHALLKNHGAIVSYDPDVTKRTFREIVRSQIDTNGSTLSRAVEKLPTEIKHRYYECIQDPWFTFAEVWRLTKPEDGDDIEAAGIASESLMLHAYCNQFCLAGAARAMQSVTAENRPQLSDFNLELQGRKRPLRSVVARLSPPSNLEELLESADIVLDSDDIALIGQLSLEEILQLREMGQDFLNFSSCDEFYRSSAPGTDPYQSWIDLERLRKRYISVFERYVRQIAHVLDRKNNGIRRKNRWAVFVETKPVLRETSENYLKTITQLILDDVVSHLPLGKTASALGRAGLTQMTTWIAQIPSTTERNFDALVPPREWRRRGIIKL